MYAEEADDYWLADHLHVVENGEFVYVKDAFGPEFAPVSLSMGRALLTRLSFLPVSCRTAISRTRRWRPGMFRLCSGLACAPTVNRI